MVVPVGEAEEAAREKWCGASKIAHTLVSAMGAHHFSQQTNKYSSSKDDITAHLSPVDLLV